MSLNFSVANIKDYQIVCSETRADGKEYWRPVTEALIFATMNVGMHNITEKNYEKFYKRLHTLECLLGKMLYRGDVWKNEHPNEPEYITEDEVKQHIGLSTNANDYTDAGFRAHLMKTIQREFGI